jgi:hypothetical protein
VCAGEGGNVLCFDYEGAAAGSEEMETTGKFLSLLARVADAIVFNIWWVGERGTH